MSEIRLHGWFKPVWRREDGWASDGYVAVMAPGMFQGVKVVDATSAVAALFAEPCVLAKEAERVNGRAIFADDRGRSLIVQAHYADLLAAAYPHGVWTIAETHLRRRVWGRTVGVAMLFKDTPEGAREGEPLEPPPCPACEGLGGKECGECEGLGEIRHECSSCGEEHECQCRACCGRGWTKRCTVCNGTKAWKIEHDAKEAA